MKRTPPSRPARSRPWIDIEMYRSTLPVSSTDLSVTVMTGISRPPKDLVSSMTSG
jgi:hypothetical protein